MGLNFKEICKILDPLVCKTPVNWDGKKCILEMKKDNAKNWKQILRVHISNSVTDEVGFVFVAENLEYGEPDFEDTEKIQIRKLPFDELLNMATSGQITDALSVAGILKLAAIRQG